MAHKEKIFRRDAIIRVRLFDMSYKETTLQKIKDLFGDYMVLQFYNRVELFVLVPYKQGCEAKAEVFGWDMYMQRAWNFTDVPSNIDPIDYTLLRLTEYPMSNRLFNILKAHGYKTISDIAPESPAHIKKIRNMGKCSFDELNNMMKRTGFWK